jgi:hypothetical protein
LFVEILEDRICLSAFYDPLTTLSSTAKGPFTSFGDLVSVNDVGDAAFVGNTAQGSGIYVVKAESDTPVNINPAFS